MPRLTGAQSLDLSGTPVQPRRSSRATRAPDRLINHTDQPRSTLAKPSNRKSKDENPRYAILIQRLAKTLEEEPPVIEEDEEEKFPFWCTCKMGSIGGESVRCDVPACNIIWWHTRCVPERYQIRARQEDELWICPNCYPLMAVNIIIEKRGRKGDTRTTEQKMVDVDERYRRDGRWIFDEPKKDAIDPEQAHPHNEQPTSRPGDRAGLGLIQEKDRPISDMAASDRLPTVQPTSSLDAPYAVSTRPIEYSGSPAVPTVIELKAPGARPRSKADNMSMSVYNLRSLEASARLWTSPETSVTESKEGYFIAKYKHGLDFPGASEFSEDDSPCIRFVCSEASRGTTTVDVPLALLYAFGADLRTHIDNTIPRGAIVSLHLSQVDNVVFKRVVEFLRGYPLFVNLGTLEKPLADKQKLWLIQHTHLAHIFNIKCLQRAAMHALCASILRHSEDWADTSASQRLLDEFTTEGNPARRALLEGPGCMLPSATGMETLPCSQRQVESICSDNAWGQGGTPASQSRG